MTSRYDLSGYFPAEPVRQAVMLLKLFITFQELNNLDLTSECSFVSYSGHLFWYVVHTISSQTFFRMGTFIESTHMKL